jgi:hypothetical protein
MTPGIGGAVLVIAPFVFAVMMALLAARRRAVRRFQQASAPSAGAAINGETFHRAESWWLSKLASAGVVRDDSHGRVWLDEVAWAAYRGQRRKRALTALAVGAAGLALLWWGGVIGG